MNFELKDAIIRKYGHQYQFALVVQTREEIVSKTIHGRHRLTPETQAFWAKALDVEPETIFSE